MLTNNLLCIKDTNQQQIFQALKIRMPPRLEIPLDLQVEIDGQPLDTELIEWRLEDQMQDHIAKENHKSKIEIINMTIIAILKNKYYQI